MRASRARRPRAATRRRVATGRARGIPPARRTLPRLRVRRRRPSVRTRRESSGRRRGGDGGRARGTRRRARCRGGDAPDDRRAGAAPADLDRARRCGVPDPGTETERAPRLAVGHATAVEMGVDRGRSAARPQAALLGVGEPPEREQREVAPRNDVRVVARPPELGERSVVQRRRPDTRDARVQGEKRRPRHAVLEPCPGRPLERGGPGGSRSWSEPTRRRNARICCRVSRSRVRSASITSERAPRRGARGRFASLGIVSHALGAGGLSSGAEATARAR